MNRNGERLTSLEIVTKQDREFITDTPRINAELTYDVVAGDETATCNALLGGIELTTKRFVITHSCAGSGSGVGPTIHPEDVTQFHATVPMVLEGAGVEFESGTVVCGDIAPDIIVELEELATHFEIPAAPDLPSIFVLPPDVFEMIDWKSLPPDRLEVSEVTDVPGLDHMIAESIGEDAAPILVDLEPQVLTDLMHSSDAIAEVIDKIYAQQSDAGLVNGPLLVDGEIDPSMFDQLVDSLGAPDG
ncbi:MAG: hypothetical protein HKN44_05865 [Ilumatobacter sp.]|nr:hypothetical protein [Ilumatobacter sp.]